MTQWDGDDYQARFDALAATGKSMHGEVDFVLAHSPTEVLDAGCGTGRVAIELAARGIPVEGVDVDESMLATARSRGPEVTWHLEDLCRLALGRRYDVVVMAGNVPLFTPAGTEGRLVECVANHVGRLLIAGFSIDRHYGIDEYDAHCADAGLVLAERFSTWDRDPFTADSDYAVSVHRPG